MTGKIKGSDYDQFQCISDKCSITCCQEWRIGVDDTTYKKWEGRSLNDGQLLCEGVKQDAAGGYIKLNKDKKCPFLNEHKLCKVVIEHGEDYLSETCTTFPRQVTKYEDRTEYALMAGCEKVVDMLYANKLKLHTEDVVTAQMPLSYHIREMMMTLMQDTDYTLPERFMILFYSLLELQEERNVTVEKIKCYTNKKHMRPLLQAIKKMAFDEGENLYEVNELFLDVVENYRKQKLYTNYLEPIAIQAEQLEEKYDEKVLLQKRQVFDKLLSPYEQLLTNYCVAEIFANGMSQEESIEGMCVVFQWLALEYAVLKQAIFLNWLESKEKELSYEMVRDYIVVITRVTGYEEADIREYLENSFQSILWDWGYLALIVGNNKL